MSTRDTTDNDARLTELELKLTYQEDMVETLNQVIIELRGDLQRLQQNVKQLEHQIAQGLPESGPANDPPPHY